MSELHHPVLLVTGAAGQLGRRVLELLLDAPHGTIIGTTRAPEKLADFAARGVVVRKADFDDPSSLAAAFAGVDRLLLISTDTVGEPGQRIKQHVAAVQAADTAGVKHVLYTSIIEPEPVSPAFVAPDHLATEQALTASKMGYTFLRNNIYTDLQIPTLARAIQSGQLYGAAGDGKTAYITREDCARAAAAALASSFEGRRILNITGPESLSQADLARSASEISGRPVAYVPLTIEAAIQGMVAAGLPQAAAAMYATFDLAAAQGIFDVVTNAVEELTGRKPISVADFLAANRDKLVQGASVQSTH